MVKCKHIFWAFFLSFIISACAVSTKTEQMIPVTEFRKNTVVIEDGFSRVQLINAFRQAGWDVQFSGILAGKDEAEKIRQYREKSMIKKEDINAPVANYMVFVSGAPSGLCADLSLGTDLVSGTVGINPHYIRYKVTIYDVRTSRSVYSILTGGCEDKVMVNIRRELSKLVMI